VIPKAALALLPLLAAEAALLLPQVPPHYLAGQVEQESCLSLTHPKCWNVHAELKTSREYGFGLGQMTLAYRPDGSIRFNSFEESKRKFRELKDWTWENRFDARYQLRAMILMDREAFAIATWAKDGLNHAAMMFVIYNSGRGDLARDRQLCRQTPGCDPELWFDNIERQSVKSRLADHGYGKSFFAISREYPRQIIFTRAPRYLAA
jgi:hypothetical protein